LLAELAQKGQKEFQVANLDLDTGYEIRPGTYKLTDETYAKLLDQLTRTNPYRRTPMELKQNVLAFYADPNAPIETKKHRRAWQKVQKDLALLSADGVDAGKSK
jgi:hypothetical protein